MRLMALLGFLCFSFLCREAFSQREVKWNNPGGERNAGLKHGSFKSPSMGVEIGYNVSLPPGYERGDARYPVIYFLHGAGGDENSDAGGFSDLAKRMAAQKKIPPVICVFPNGGMSGYRDRPEQKVMGETMIVKELIPRIDRLYRTQRNREGRAIAGYSMGGGGAIRLALKHPDLFSAAASWAGSFGNRNGASPELEVEPLRRHAGRVRLLLIVGDEDMTYGGHQPVLKNLKEADYPYSYRALEGVSHDLGRYYELTGEELMRLLAEKFKKVAS